MKKYKILCAATGLLSLVAVGASQPQFDLQLVARTGATGFVPAFNFPINNSISSYRPSINDNGVVAIRMETGSNRAIWRGTSLGGDVVATSTNFIGDVWINSSGDIVWAESGNIQRYSAASGTTSLYTNLPAGSSSVGGLRLGNDGTLGYRATVGSSRLTGVFDPSGPTFTPWATEGTGTTFLLTPYRNRANQFAMAAQIATGPSRNEVRIYSAPGQFISVAQDQATNPQSPYSSFFNNLGFNDGGWVAFNAALVGGGRGIYLSNGTDTIEIVNTNTSPVVGSMESFDMVVTNDNIVIFRAIDKDNRRALFAGDGRQLWRIASQFDTVQTDLGPAVIRWPNDSASAFSSSPTNNIHEQVAFVAALVNPAVQTEQWGLGMFVATPSSFGNSLLWQNETTGQMTTWSLDGGEATAGVDLGATPSDWKLVGAGSIIPGTRSNLVFHNSVTGELALWSINHLGAVTATKLIGAASLEWTPRAVKDLNRDGVADILWQNGSGAIARWTLDTHGDVSGTLFLGSAPTGWRIFGVANISQNPNPDIGWANDSTGHIVVWATASNGLPAESRTVGFTGSAHWQAVAFARPDTNAIVFQNSATGGVAYWNIDDMAEVTGTGLLGIAPSGWRVRAGFNF
ncbi:MAG: hypothetical protein ACK4P3_02095 [Fimbriimonadaceae bacterium]